MLTFMSFFLVGCSGDHNAGGAGIVSSPRVRLHSAGWAALRDRAVLGSGIWRDLWDGRGCPCKGDKAQGARGQTPGIRIRLDLTGQATRRGGRGGEKKSQRHEG